MLCFFQKVISKRLYKQLWEEGGPSADSGIPISLMLLRRLRDSRSLTLASSLALISDSVVQVFSRANRRSSCKLAFDSREVIFWAWTVTLACIWSSFSSSAETAVLKSAERACRCSSRRLAMVAMLNSLLTSPGGSGLACWSLVLYLVAYVVISWWSDTQEQ